MIVTVKPKGREEYRLDLSGTPEWSVGGFGGATVPCLLNDDQRLNVRGGRLRIHGESGIVYQGIVIRRPGAGEPLEAQGWGWCGSLGRRKVMYAKTDFLRDLSDFNGTNWGLFTRSITGGNIYIAQNPNTTAALNNGGGYRYQGDIELSRLTFTAAVNTTNMSLMVYATDINGSFTGSATTWSTPGTFTGQTFTFPSGAYGFYVWGNITGASSPTDTAVWVGMYTPTLYGKALTAVQSRYILDDILTNEVSTDWLPSGTAYRAWMEADSTAWDVCEFDSCTASDKVSEILKHSAYDFGWYNELVSGQTYCVPHWTARETTPSLVLRLEEAESYDLDEAALDELVSAVRVNYHDVNGKTVYVDVTDTDTTHPLVALGITRWGETTVDTSSSTTATTMGQLYLADKGRAQLKGTVTTRLLRSSTGAEVYLPDVRIGQLVRVLGLPDGYVNCRVTAAKCKGDSLLTLTLDNSPYALDIALAQITKRL